MKTPKRKKTTQAEKRSFTPADRLRELADAIEMAVSVRDTCQWLPSVRFLDGTIPEDAKIIATYYDQIATKKAEINPAAERLWKAFHNAKGYLTEDEAVLLASQIDTFRVYTFDVDEEAMGPTQKHLKERDRSLLELETRLRVRADQWEEKNRIEAKQPPATYNDEADEKRLVMFGNNFQSICILTRAGKRGKVATLRRCPVAKLLRQLFEAWGKDPESYIEWSRDFVLQLGYVVDKDGLNEPPSRRWRDSNKKNPNKKNVLKQIIGEKLDVGKPVWVVYLKTGFRYAIE